MVLRLYFADLHTSFSTSFPQFFTCLCSSPSWTMGHAWARATTDDQWAAALRAMDGIREQAPFHSWPSGHNNSIVHHLQIVPYARKAHSDSALRSFGKTIVTGEDSDAKQPALDGKQCVPKQNLSRRTICTVTVEICRGTGFWIASFLSICGQFLHSSFDFVNTVHCFLQKDGTVNVGVKWQKAVQPCCLIQGYAVMRPFSPSNTWQTSDLQKDIIKLYVFYNKFMVTCYRILTRLAHWPKLSKFLIVSG